MALRQEHALDLRRLFAPPALAERQRQPHGGMAVLPAVFPDAGAVASDVAGGALTLRKRRGKELYEGVLPVNKIAQGAVQRGVGVFRTAEGGPYLRQQVDPLLAAERTAVRPVAAAVEAAVEAALRGAAEPLRRRAKAVSDLLGTPSMMICNISTRQL